jgi:hypothetical protein
MENQLATANSTCWRVNRHRRGNGLLIRVNAQIYHRKFRPGWDPTSVPIHILAHTSSWLHSAVRGHQPARHGEPREFREGNRARQSLLHGRDWHGGFSQLNIR